MDQGLHDATVQAALQVWDAAALCATFWGVSADGVAGKADHVGQLDAGPAIGTYALSDVPVRGVGADHALIVYRADRARPAGGWRNIFSQDTAQA